MRVFVDTNIYLGFIRSSDEDPNSINELLNLVSQEKIILILPEITENELIRNVSNVQYAYIKELQQNLLKPPKFAASLKNKRIRKDLEKLCEDYSEGISRLTKDYIASVEKITSKILSDLKPKAVCKSIDAGLIEKARTRKSLGNPPGKQEHIGDELEWETLLSYYFDDDLTIITNDKDWKDPLNQDQLNKYLEQEWKKFSKKKIYLYNTLGQFINKFTQEEKISAEEIKTEESSSSQSELYANPVKLDQRYVSFASGASVYPGDLLIADPTMIVGSMNSPLATMPQYCQNCGEKLSTSFIHLCKPALKQ